MLPSAIAGLLTRAAHAWSLHRPIALRRAGHTDGHISSNSLFEPLHYGLRALYCPIARSIKRLFEREPREENEGQDLEQPSPQGRGEDANKKEKAHMTDGEKCLWAEGEGPGRHWLR